MYKITISHFLLKWLSYKLGYINISMNYVYSEKLIKKGRYSMGDKNPNKQKKKKKTVEKVAVQPVVTNETISAKKPKK